MAINQNNDIKDTNMHQEKLSEWPLKHLTIVDMKKCISAASTINIGYMGICIEIVGPIILPTQN